jgi:hypothetical protein
MELTALRAELTKSDTATAAGIAVKAESPVLALCRSLINAGYDPATTLNVYRGNTPALRIGSIGEAGALDIAGDGVGFRPRKKLAAPNKPVTAPSIAPNQLGATTAHATVTPAQEIA